MAHLRMMTAMAVVMAVAAGAAGARDELGPYGRLPGPPAEAQAKAWTETDPPLFEGLGTLAWPVTTARPEAQDYFDQGLRWSFAFNHAEALRAFRKAQRVDPGCAMCAWGEALVLGPNINKPMDPADLPAAMAALARARELAPAATPKEQAMIAALEARYTAQGADDSAYAESMANVARRFPDDLNIQTLYAEALMDTQPWDYWEADRVTPKGNTEIIVGTLERVLAANSDHPGAIHLYIHAVEASANPERALPHARRLARLMPAAGHIVHMPAHIYYRLGMWRESLEQNKKAAAADERYFAKVGRPAGIYRDGYAPHNLHFVLVSAQMAGDGGAALSAAQQLADSVTVEGARAVPWAQPIKAAPYFAHAQFSDTETVLDLPDPGNELPYVRAMWHYARGVALAEKGLADRARVEASAIRTLADEPEIAGLEEAGVPASDVLAVANHVVRGLAARAESDFAQAIGELRRAVAIEDRLSYTEPPWWYYPVRQSLGATLMMAGDLAGAEQAFRESLEQVPNNGWALYGLMEVQQAQGKTGEAQRTASEFRRAWAGRQTPQLAGL